MIEKINHETTEFDIGSPRALKIVAEKLNEIIDKLNEITNSANEKSI